jgi:hypothetical protein
MAEESRTEMTNSTPTIVQLSDYREWCGATTQNPFVEAILNSKLFAAHVKDLVEGYMFEVLAFNTARDQNPIKDDPFDSIYIKYFYLAPNDELKYSSGAIADFSKLFSVRNKSFDFLLERKVAQLSEESFESLALKLSLYFYRNERELA